MILFLEEIGTTANSTASHLFVDNKPFCFVIEDGHRDQKIAGETRIPAGKYQIVPRREGKFYEQYKRQHGHNFVPHLLNVPNFGLILIHIGNTIKDTRGCLLANRFVGLGTDGNYLGSDSTSIYKLLYSLMAKALARNEEIWIEIQRREIVNENENFG